MKKLKLFFLFVFVSIVINAQGVPAAETTTQIYVNASAVGLENGTSWANAYTNLNDALSDNRSRDIWVARGVYIPGSTRTSTFSISNKKIYGGFVGTETLFSQRDFKTNKTVLSGDLLGNDSNTSFLYTSRSLIENAYHVITVTGLNVVLDGVTVSGGNANGPSSQSSDRGGAIYLNNNSANGITVTNAIIEKNVSNNLGNIYLTPARGGVNEATFTNTIFRDNLANNAVVLYSSMNSINLQLNTTLNNCLVYNNYIKNRSNNSGINYLFWLRTERNGAKQNLTVNNTTITNNQLQGTGNFIENSIFSMSESGNNLTVTSINLNNNIFWNNPAIDSKSVVVLGNHFNNLPYADGVASNNIDEDLMSNISNNSVTINSDPLFEDAANGVFNLLGTSPAINIGNNGSVPTSLALDLEGNNRIQGSAVDLGAYEFAAGNTLTLSATNGTITTNPNPVNGTYANRAVVTLTAVPDAGYEFVSWSGDIGSTTNPTTINMNGNRTAIANFRLIQRRIFITAVNGSVLRNPSPSTGTYDDGSTIILFARPDAGYQFDGFVDSNTGANLAVNKANPLSATITMDADKNITANFSSILSIQENSFSRGIKIYPNPVSSTLNIKTENINIKTIELFNLLGKKVLETNKSSINISNFSKGVYLVKIQNNSGEIAIRKIIKE